MKNPYDWTSPTPAFEIERAVLSELEAAIKGDGDSRIVALVGGRGMGKTVLPRQLQARLGSEPDVQVVRVERPPLVRTALAAADTLRQRLDVTGVAPGFAEGELVGMVTLWMQRNPGRQLVLLFDETDTYIRDGDDGWAKDFFNALRVAYEACSPRLSIVVAGGAGLYLLGEELGSPLLSRADWKILSPFTANEVETFVGPFSDRGTPMDGDTRSALFTLSGGHPLLLAYELQRLWRSKTISPAEVALGYERFQEAMEEFLLSVQRGAGFERTDGATRRLWTHLRDHEGPYPRHELAHHLEGTAHGPQA